MTQKRSSWDMGETFEHENQEELPPKDEEIVHIPREASA